MKKTLHVQNINTTLATIAMNIKSKPSTTILVLSELISASDNGIITHPAIVGNSIRKTLSISEENYRASIAKLTKLKLIVRDQSTLFLSVSIRPPFSDIIIKQIP